MASNTTPMWKFPLGSKPRVMVLRESLLKSICEKNLQGKYLFFLFISCFFWDHTQPCTHSAFHEENSLPPLPNLDHYFPSDDDDEEENDNDLFSPSSTLPPIADFDRCSSSDKDDDDDLSSSSYHELPLLLNPLAPEFFPAKFRFNPQARKFGPSWCL